MGKYLKKFTELTAYTAAQSSLILPNVSLVTEGNMVKYNPTEKRLIAEYNVTTISEATRILGYEYASGFSSIEIDGVEQPSISTGHTFDTTGKHVIKYTLGNPTIIGGNALWGCDSLSSVTIPNSITSIGERAFRYNSGLTRVNSDTDGVFNIPNGVVTISREAFAQCNGMTDLIIPDSVTSIGTMAFWESVNLTACTMGTGVTVIGSSAFHNCYTLKRLNSDTDGVFNIPNGVITLENGAFRNLSGMTSVTIPDSVTTIDENCFRTNENLTSITIPSGVTSIGYYALYYCSSLTSITIEAVTPPTLNSYAFDNTNDCPIYVPSGSVDTYKAASGWSTYASRIQPIA